MLQIDPELQFNAHDKVLFSQVKSPTPAVFYTSPSFSRAHIWHLECDGFTHLLPNELQELISSRRIAHINEEGSSACLRCRHPLNWGTRD